MTEKTPAEIKIIKDIFNKAKNNGKEILRNELIALMWNPHKIATPEEIDNYIKKQFNEGLKQGIELGRKESEEENKKLLSDLQEKIKKRIMINGNLSNRIIETEEGEFENKHDLVLNNIVMEVINEEISKIINYFQRLEGKIDNLTEEELK